MGAADAKFASYPPSPLKLPVTDKAMSCTSSFDLPGSKLHHPSPANPYQSMAAYTTEATFPHSYPTTTTHSSAFAMKQNGDYTDSYGGYSSAMQGLKSQVSGMSGPPASGQQSLSHSWPFYGLSSRSMTSQMTSERSPMVKQEMAPSPSPSHHPLLGSFSPKSAWLPSSSEPQCTSPSFGLSSQVPATYATSGHYATTANPYR